MEHITDRIFKIDNQAIDLSEEFKEKIEEIWEEAIEKSNDDSYVEGVSDVLDSMIHHGMKGSAAIVENYLITDGVIEVSGDAENDDEDEEDSDDKKRNPKRGKIKENAQYISDISKMIG